jgi:hypothetical protein
MSQIQPMSELPGIGAGGAAWRPFARIMAAKVPGRGQDKHPRPVSIC